LNNSYPGCLKRRESFTGVSSSREIRDSGLKGMMRDSFDVEIDERNLWNSEDGHWLGSVGDRSKGRAFAGRLFGELIKIGGQRRRSEEWWRRRLSSDKVFGSDWKSRSIAVAGKDLELGESFLRTGRIN
jgi:hypothetical protein